MKSEKIKEALFNRYDDIDPHGEEDWDEYELTSGDKLYFFVINDDCTVEAGVGKAVLKGDYFYMKIDTVINKKEGDKYKYPTEIKLTSDIKTNISRNNFSTHTFNLSRDGSKNIVAIVNNFKFHDKFGAIQKAIRTNLLNVIRNTRTNVQNIEQEVDTKETRTVDLKNKLKSIDQYPDPQFINMDDDQFLVIRSKKEGYGDDISIEIKLTKVKEKTNDKGEKGFYLVDDSESKVVYMKDNFDKLKERGYLLLKSKKSKENKTYVTKSKDLYKQFLKRIVKDVNIILEKEIETNRDSIDKSIEKINTESDKIREYRGNYRSLKIMDLVDKIKEFEGEKYTTS